MHISERALEYPRFVLLGGILLCALGFAAYFTLPKERTPRVKLPVIIVAVPNAGAQPPTNEREILRRIETESGSLSNLKNRGSVLSQSVNGAAVIQFVFSDGVEVDEAKRDVESLVNRIKGEFPPAAQADPGPIVNDIAFEDWPIIQVFVAGGDNARQRRRIAERLKDVIESVPGVSGVDIFGGLEDEVLIAVNPHLMTLYGFSYDDVAMAIRRANADLPSGSIETGPAEVRVRTEAKPARLDDIRAVPIGVRNGTPVLVQDVAEVSLSHKPLTSLARYEGRDAAVVLARARTDIDVLAAANRVQAIVDEFIESGQGDNTIIGTSRSQAREIHYMMNQLGSNAAWGMVLVFLILLVFLGWRNAVMIGIAVPFALLSTSGIMWFAKRSIAPDLAINNMVLFAMILVIGMVVDGCIIVGENIFRHREEGKAPLPAAKHGIREVGISLLTAYLTTFAAFAPMFMVRGVMGDFMKLLPTVVFFALLAAMLVDHFLLPVISVYFMKSPANIKPRDENMTADEAELAGAREAIAASPVKRRCGAMVRYTLHHRLLALTLAVIVSLTPVGLFVSGAIGFEFFPTSDIPIIEVYYELPLGSSMEQKTVEVGEAIEQAVMRAVREEEWYKASAVSPRARPVTTIGEPGALNINLDAEASAGPEFGMVFVELEIAEQRERTSAEIRQAIVDELPPLPGVVVRVKSPSEGPPAGSPVLVRVLGHRETTLAALAAHARRIESVVATTPGVYDVTNDHRMRPGLKVEPNDVVASMFDLDPTQINLAINYALDGVRLGEVDFGGDELIDMRLQNLPADRDELRDLADLPLRSPSGRVVSLEQVADIERISTANIIRHYDRRRVINVRSELREGALADDVKARLLDELRPELTPTQRLRMRGESLIYSDDQVMIEFGGENEIRDDALEDLNIAMAIAFMAMLIILTIQFNSFVQPLIILFSVPLSLVGVTIGLMVCGLNFSIAAMIGVVSLSGIVVNDAIVLVDFINRLRAAGMSKEDACITAAQLRLRPIFLTTVTTIGGLLPLAMNLGGGGEFWQPLTVTIMGGLGFATLLQLFVIPIAYFTFQPESNVSVLDPAHHPKYSGTSA